MMCSKLHCQKGLKLKPFSYKSVRAFPIWKQTTVGDRRAGFVPWSTGVEAHIAHPTLEIAPN